MKKFLLAGAVASAMIASASAASATTFTVTFSPFQYALPAGETLFTNFSGGLPSNAAGTAIITTGSSTAAVAPALSKTTKVTGNYMYVPKNGSETFTFNSGAFHSGLKEISFYVGSLDSLNSWSFDGGTLYLGSSVPGASAVGSQTAGVSNGLVTFKFSAPITSVKLGSTVRSFEIAEIGVSAVPEPAAWSMMIAGVGLVGGALRTRRRRATVAAAA
jgi:hypothetical protein